MLSFKKARSRKFGWKEFARPKDHDREWEEIYSRFRFSPWVGRPPATSYEDLIFYVPTFLGGHAVENRPKMPM